MKKYSWALAIISLIISISALIASFRIETFHVGIESVMGLVTALMGICATFMVGWQIFSSINVNKELENIKLANENFKEKIKQLDNLIESQKEEIAQEKEERYLMKKELNAQLWSARAFSFIDKRYFTVYECFAESLYLFLELQKNEKAISAIRNMEVTLNGAETALQEMEENKRNGHSYDTQVFLYQKNTKADGGNWPIKRMSSSPGFQLIKDKIDELEKRRLELNKRVNKLKQ